jgi:L-malate glycosyltransferase
MALDLCRNAVANGLELTFLATGGGDLEADFRASGVEFLKLQRRLPVDLKLASQIRRIIEERGIQIVHSHQPVEALHLYLATRNSPVKRVLTLHGFYPGAKNDLALRFVLPRTQKCIAVSQEVLKLARDHGIDKQSDFIVVDNGVDAKRLRSCGKRLRDELGLVAEQVLFGMIGNFHPVAQKDQMTVCRALPRVFQAVPQAHFVFVGGRSEAAPQLFDDCVNFCREAGLAERVHFIGKRSDIGEILNSLDLFVLSTLREGSPISVIEAMMMGVPTVLADIGALREISEDGQHAELFKVGDAAELAAKLIRIHQDDQARAGLAASAQQWAIRRFSIESHIAGLLDLYRSLVC